MIRIQHLERTLDKDPDARLGKSHSTNNMWNWFWSKCSKTTWIQIQLLNSTLESPCMRDKYWSKYLWFNHFFLRSRIIRIFLLLWLASDTCPRLLIGWWPSGSLLLIGWPARLLPLIGWPRGRGGRSFLMVRVLFLLFPAALFPFHPFNLKWKKHKNRHKKGQPTKDC